MRSGVGVCWLVCLVQVKELGQVVAGACAGSGWGRAVIVGRVVVVVAVAVDMSVAMGGLGPGRMAGRGSGLGVAGARVRVLALV